jgi:hypothetical protein
MIYNKWTQLFSPCFFLYIFHMKPQLKKFIKRSFLYEFSRYFCSQMQQILLWFRFMVFNVNFNNISVISWQSILLVEKTTDMSQVTDKLYHILL